MTSISNFEREKPVAIMKALNSLIKELRGMDIDGYSVNPSWILGKLEKIKDLFKNGE